MYDKILFPTDGSETASSAFDYAMAVASAHGATVHVLNVADTTDLSVTRVGGDVVDALEEDGTSLVEEYAERAQAADLSVVTDVYQGHPAETIVGYAEEFSIDLIVMPTHGRSGLQRYLLGSVTERVVETADIPILTVTPSEGEEFVYPPQNILLPTDGSQCATLALEHAADIAHATDAELDLLTVVETASLGIDVRSTVVSDKLEDRATEILDTARETAEKAAVEEISTTTAHGQPYREIRSYITDNDVDLVVLGTHGETNFSRYVLGGVSDKLIRTSPIPVLLIPGSDTDSE
jgi:nucleotide-binding universal stress UspA family protein